MKKLMVAVVSAASAIFAFGDLPHGADFEANGYVVGESFTNYLNKADDGVATTGGRYWQSSGEEIGSIATNELGGPVGVDVVPDYFTNAVSNCKYLQLDSGKTRLLRNIASDGTAVSMSTGDGIYLDTLVKFSAASSLLDSDFETGDKLAIAYVGELDDGNYLSNFVVRAGFIGELLPTNYCAYVPDIATFDVEGWHRLTIRTLTNIDGKNRAGFKIYVDGTNLVYRTDKEGFAAAAGFADDTHTIFPSALEAGQTDADTITAVAFAGNGSIDDVVFTTTKPDFIKEAAVVTVTWDPDEVTAVTLNNTALNAEDVAKGSYDIEPDNGVVTFSIVPVAGYVLGTCTVTPDKGGWNGSDAFTNLTAGAVCNIDTIYRRYEVNNVVYEDLEAAVAEASKGTDVAPATFKLLAACAQGLAFTEGYVILDLNGFSIQGASTDDYTIGNAGATLFITNSGAEASIMLPADNPFAGGAVMTAAGFTTVQAGTFEGAVLTMADYDTSFPQDFQLVTGGKFFDDGYDPTDPENPFYLAACVASGHTYTKDGDYVVVGGAAPTPTPTQVAVPTAASNLVYDGTEKTGVAAGTGYTIVGNIATNAGNYTATATLEDDYIWEDGTSDPTNIAWSIAAKTDATVVVTLSDNDAEYSAQLEFPTVTANVGNEAVFGTTVWDPASIAEPSAAGVTNDYTVTFTVTNGNYTGSTGTATFKVWKAAAPSGWVVDPETIAESTTAETEYGITGDLANVSAKSLTVWAKANSVDFATFAAAPNTFEEAYLLNCAATAEAVATAKANFKVTSITVVGDTVTITPADAADYGNGQIVIEGAAAITSPMSWHTKTTGDKFFRATLVVKPVTP